MLPSPLLLGLFWPGPHLGSAHFGPALFRLGPRCARPVSSSALAWTDRLRGMVQQTFQRWRVRDAKSTLASGKQFRCPAPPAMVDDQKTWGGDRSIAKAHRDTNLFTNDAKGQTLSDIIPLYCKDSSNTLICTLNEDHVVAQRTSATASWHIPTSQ